MNEDKQSDELIEFGKATEETKGAFLHGFLYDGGVGYYYPDTDPYWP